MIIRKPEIIIEMIIDKNRHYHSISIKTRQPSSSSLSTITNSACGRSCSNANSVELIVVYPPGLYGRRNKMDTRIIPFRQQQTRRCVAIGTIICTTPIHYRSRASAFVGFSFFPRDSSGVVRLIALTVGTFAAAARCVCSLLRRVVGLTTIMIASRRRRGSVELATVATHVVNCGFHLAAQSGEVFLSVLSCTCAIYCCSLVFVLFEESE